MTIFTTAEDLIEYIDRSDYQIHFVPTMGALHDGHISLIQRAQLAKETTLCSIFVNPTQFNNAQDLKHYPRTIEQDIELLIQAGCDILYLPSVEDIYPNGMDYQTDVDISFHARFLEGHHRPGHFEGVVQVVDRFLDIIQPHAIYLGEKDYQQVQVISQLVRQKHADVQVIPCPTLRDEDGLAKSSRNKRLSSEQRALAPLIYKSLKSIIDQKGKASFSDAKSQVITDLENRGFRIDYIELLDTEHWEILDEFTDGPMVILAAVFLGDIRLIDNILF